MVRLFDPSVSRHGGARLAFSLHSLKLWFKNIVCVWSLQQQMLFPQWGCSHISLAPDTPPSSAPSGSSQKPLRVVAPPGSRR